MKHSETPPLPCKLSRRALLSRLGVAVLAPMMPGIRTVSAQAAPAPPSQLPLKTTGLEHLGTVVPDVEAAGRFYGRLFDPQLYKEKEPPLRYYVRLGVGYLALGSRANQPRAFFDHFCALVQDYDARAMAQQLEAEGLPPGRFGITPDPDGIGLQLLSVPGGLAKSTEPAGRIVDGDALVHPERLTDVVLHVSDLGKSVQFYRHFFGPEIREKRLPQQAAFQIAETRLLLQAVTSGEAARVERIRIRVQPFDHHAVSRELAQLGARVASHSKHELAFTDPLGLGLELRSA